MAGAGVVGVAGPCGVAGAGRAASVGAALVVGVGGGPVVEAFVLELVLLFPSC